MPGKNLTFKLIMEGDNKGLVTSAKQSQEVVSKVFDTIKQEAEQVKKTSQDTSKAIGDIGSSETKQKVAQLVSELYGASQALDGLGKDANLSAENLKHIGDYGKASLDKLQIDLEKARQNLNYLSATNATPANIDEAQREVKELEQGVKRVKIAFDAYSDAANTSISAINEVGGESLEAAQQVKKLDTELSQTNVELKNTETTSNTTAKSIHGLRTGVTALAGAMAALGVGLSVRELADAADSYTNLSARINIATKDGGDFTSAMAGVHQVALMTNSSLAATGDLFTRLNTVGKDMGMTQQQALDLTKTVTQAIQVGGGSAQASEAAITQFIQAMQGGVLRGEEFNSIMENGYGVAEALAKGLGVTTGELRKMAENGELSAVRVVKALQSQASEVQKTYDQFPTTISNALQKISTSWEGMIGKMDQSNGASATVAEWLVTIADNIDVVETLLNDMGEGFVWVGDQLKKIDPVTIEALKIALVTAYESIKELGSTLGDGFERGVDVINTTLGSIFDFNSGVDTASDKTNGLTKALQALNVVFGFIGDGFNAINIVANLLTGVFYDVAAAWQNFKSKFTWGDTKTEIIAEMNAMAEKAQEYYNKASNGAMDFKSKGIEAIQEISKTQQQKDAESVASSKAAFSELMKKNEDLVQKSKDLAQEREVIDARLNQARTDGNAAVVDSILKQSTELEVREKANAANKAKLDSESLASTQAYAEAAIQANKGAMDGVMQADLMTKGYIVTMDQAGKVSVEAWQKNTGAATGTANKLDQARKGAAALGVDLDNALNRVSEKFTSTEASLDGFALGMKDLGLEGEAATNALYLGWSKWLEIAKNQAEIDAAKSRLQSFGEQGKLSASQVEIGLQAVKRAALELPDSISPVEAAFERLGIKTKEQLKLSAELAMNDFNTIMKSGEATQEGLQKAYEETIRLAYASGDAQTIAAANAKAAYLGLEVQLDSTGKATVAKLGEMQQAAVATQRTIQQVSNSSSNSKSEEATADNSNDYWDAFEKKMADRTAKSNAASQARRSSNASGVKAPIGTDSALTTQPVIPDAPMIASSFDMTPIETGGTNKTVDVNLNLGQDKFTVQTTPTGADSLESLVQKLELINKGQ